MVVGLGLLGIMEIPPGESIAGMGGRGGHNDRGRGVGPPEGYRCDVGHVGVPVAKPVGPDKGVPKELLELRDASIQ